MIKEKIHSLGLMIIVFCTTKAAFVSYGFTLISGKSGTATLIALPIGLALGVVFSLIFLKIMDYEPDKTLIGKINSLFPKPINYLFIAISMLIGILMSGITLYMLGDFLATQYLTTTPALLIMGLIVFIMFYLVSKNFEVFTRFSTLVFGIICVIILISLLTLFQHIEIDNFKPMIINKGKILTSAFYIALVFTTPTFLLTMFPKNNIVDKEKLKKTYFIFYALSALDLITMYSFTIGCLGINITNIFQYPVYVLMKKIAILNFIENIENVTFITFQLYIFITCVLSLFFLKIPIQQAIKSKMTEKKSMIIASVLCVIALLQAYFFYKYANIIPLKLYYSVPVVTSIVTLAVGTIIFIFTLIKKQKNK